MRRTAYLKTCAPSWWMRSEEHTSELQSRSDLVCRLLLEKKKTTRAFIRPCIRESMGADPQTIFHTLVFSSTAMDNISASYHTAHHSGSERMYHIAIARA